MATPTARGHEGRREPREHRLVERSPVAAVDEDERAARRERGKEVDAVPRIGPVRHVDLALEGAAHVRGILLPAREEGGMLGHQRAVVVLALDEIVGRAMGGKSTSL
jgi:hypothetical protein